MNIIDATRAEIEPFMAHEWMAENARRFTDWATPPDWTWHEHCLAAYEGEEMIGVAIYRVRGGVAHLSNIISSGMRRSQAIGGALMDEFERRARAMGCHKLTLVTYFEDQSVRFYRRHGFAIEAILHDDAFHLDRCQLAKFIDQSAD